MSGLEFVILPSNDPSFKENRMNKYRVKLPHPLKLDGPYMVGVHSIMYKHSWNRFKTEETKFFTHLTNGDVVEAEFPKSNLKDISTFENTLNENFRNGFSKTYPDRFKRATGEKSAEKEAEKEDEKEKDNSGAREYNLIEEQISETTVANHGRQDTPKTQLLDVTNRSELDDNGQRLYPAEAQKENVGEEVAIKAHAVPEQEALEMLHDRLDDDLKAVIKDAAFFQDKNGHLLVFPKNADSFTIYIGTLVRDKMDQSVISKFVQHREGGAYISGHKRIKLSELREKIQVQLDAQTETDIKNGRAFEYIEENFIIVPKKSFYFKPIFVDPLGEVSREISNYVINIFTDKNFPEIIDANDRFYSDWDEGKSPVPIVRNDAHKNVLDEWDGKEGIATVPTVAPPVVEKDPLKDVEVEVQERTGVKRKNEDEGGPDDKKAKTDLKRPAEEEIGPAPKKTRFEEEDYKRLKKDVGFKFNSANSRFEFSDTDLVDFIQFPERVKHFLGFEDARVLPGTVAKYTPDISADINKLCVYETCGLTEHTIFGNTMSTILRIVNVTSQEGDYVECTYPIPMYKRVMKSYIDEIEIEVRTLSGDLVDFNDGVFIVILIFKRGF